MRRMIAPRTMLALPLLIAGCATDGGGMAPAPPAVADDGGPCSDDALGGFIGQAATADLAARMLKASGARTMRWGGPGMAMTMDFRPDRLTIAYDQDMKVTSARCG